MLKTFQAQDHVLNELDFEFKELLICIVLQTNYQTLSQIIWVLQSFSILQGTCQKEWKYLIKLVTPILAKRGGEALPRGKMWLLASQRRLEMQLKLWLKDTWGTLYVLWIFIIHNPAQRSNKNTEAGKSKSPDSHF